MRWREILQSCWQMVEYERCEEKKHILKCFFSSQEKIFDGICKSPLRLGH